MKNKKSKVKTPPIGPLAERFGSYLEAGLHCFGEQFQDFDPSYIEEEKNGRGLMFSQFKEETYGREGWEQYIVAVFEHGVVWPSGASICFTNEQPPEKVALLFLSALTREIAVSEPTCSECAHTRDMFEKGGG